MRKETLPLLHDYVIRYLTLSDSNQIEDLYRRCSDDIEQPTRTPPVARDAQRLFTTLPAGKTYNDKFLLGILTPGEERLIGILDIVRDTPTTGEWYLGLLLLDPHEQNHNLKENLYHTFETWAMARGAHAIRLTINEKHEATYRFWRQLGFTEIERVPSQQIGEQEYKAIVMQRSIPA
jgi:GNAT superfamily N-acetyltransferase